MTHDVCVIHWHCSAQLSMFNMEKRYRNKIIIIIIIINNAKHGDDDDDDDVHTDIRIIICLRVTCAFIYALQSTYCICKHITLCITKRHKDTAGV